MEVNITIKNLKPYFQNLYVFFILSEAKDIWEQILHSNWAPAVGTFSTLHWKTTITNNILLHTSCAPQAQKLEMSAKGER